jgi:hypothetical protein
MDSTKKQLNLGDTPHLHVGKLIGKIWPNPIVITINRWTQYKGRQC